MLEFNVAIKIAADTIKNGGGVYDLNGDKAGNGYAVDVVDDLTGEILGGVLFAPTVEDLAVKIAEVACLYVEMWSRSDADVCIVSEVDAAAGMVDIFVCDVIGNIKIAKKVASRRGLSHLYNLSRGGRLVWLSEQAKQRDRSFV